MLLHEVLLREVPTHLVAGVNSGELRVYGSIIRSLTSGHIVGHLQETTGLANLAGKLLTTPAMLPADLAVGAVGQTVSYVQNEQIKAALSVVQSMQIASLALSTAAIGISVAGFAVLSIKLNAVQARIEVLDSRLGELGRRVEMIRHDQIAEDLVRLQTALERMEEAWLLPDPEPQWRHVASEAHFLTNQFYRRAQETLELTGPNPMLAEPFLDALALAANARITARMAAGDDQAAVRAAEESWAGLARAGDGIQLGKAALAAMEGKADPGTGAWGEALERTADELRPAVGRARDREAAAAATCLTLAELQNQRISGRMWLEAARAEDEAPLLCLIPR